MKNLLRLASKFDFDQSVRKSTQVHASPGQTVSQVHPSFQLASTLNRNHGNRKTIKCTISLLTKFLSGFFLFCIPSTVSSLGRGFISDVLV